MMQVSMRTLGGHSRNLFAAAILCLAAGPSLAGQVSVTNPDGIIGILPPQQVIVPPASAGTTSSDLTSNLANGADTGPTLSPLLSSRQTSLARQLQATALEGLSMADLQYILGVLDTKLGALPTNDPLRPILLGERMRIVEAISLQ